MLRSQLLDSLLLLTGKLVYTLPRISLRDWDAADAFVDDLFARFEGQGENAALASDWEHLTPYFYRSFVEGQAFEDADLRPIYVTGSLPWTESVFGNLPLGPVYLTNYRRDIRDLGFRLRPEGDLVARARTACVGTGRAAISARRCVGRWSSGAFRLRFAGDWLCRKVVCCR